MNKQRDPKIHQIILQNTLPLITDKKSLGFSIKYLLSHNICKANYNIHLFKILKPFWKILKILTIFQVDSIVWLSHSFVSHKLKYNVFSSI